MPRLRAALRAAELSVAVDVDRVIDHTNLSDVTDFQSLYTLLESKRSTEPLRLMTQQMFDCIFLAQKRSNLVCLGRVSVVWRYQRATVRVNRVSAWLDKAPGRAGWDNFSPGVLSLSFPELNSPFQMVCSTKCAMLMRCSVAACRTRRAPSFRWKATAPSYAAAFRSLGRELDPPWSGSCSPSTLARILDPPKSGSSSSAAIQLLLLSGVTAAIAERFSPFLKKMQSRKDVCSSPGVAMNGNKECPSLLRWQRSLTRVPDLRALRI